MGVGDGNPEPGQDVCGRKEGEEGILLEQGGVWCQSLGRVMRVSTYRGLGQEMDVGAHGG